MPEHPGTYQKSFDAFARDYGLTDESGLPVVAPAIFPVSIVDNVAEYCERTRPVLGLTTGVAAFAAVYGIVGIMNGARPFRLTGAKVLAITGATEVNAVVTIADLRTANQGTGSVIGLLRGQLALAQVVTGTTTTLAGSAMWKARSAATPVADQTFGEQLTPLPMVLRPGENLFFVATTVNITMSATFWGEQLAYRLPPNPTLIP